MTAASAMTYAGSGVVYDQLDPFKRAAIAAAIETSKPRPLKRLGFRDDGSTRGESAFALVPIRKDPYRMFHVEEGLGTKNLVADAVYERTGDTTGFTCVAQDTIAMIINDMATLGGFPLSVQMHLAVGTSAWMTDGRRAQALIDGWRDACLEARCVWAGGETPALKGVVEPGTFLLGGSAVGVTKKGHKRLSATRIRPGDAIMLAPSTGVHANGLTLCREIAKRSSAGYQTLLEPPPQARGMPAQSYGEALLKPTPLYSVLLEDLMDAGVDVRYAVNITGHGWRKFMRAPQPLIYRIAEIPHRPSVFNFVQKWGRVENREMYANYNMGVGFAVYIDPRHVAKAEKAGATFGLHRGGDILPSPDGRKRVIIGHDFLSFDGDELQVR